MACPRTAGGSGPSNNYGHPAMGRVERLIGRLRLSGDLSKDSPTPAEIVDTVLG